MRPEIDGKSFARGRREPPPSSYISPFELLCDCKPLRELCILVAASFFLEQKE